jgi:hypothetical protein
MTADQRPSSFEMKLTIARDECPSVYEALSPIRDAKHRARRMRELASKGLLLEGHGLALGSSAGIKQSSPTPGAVESMPLSTGIATVGDLLDWDSDAT